MACNSTESSNEHSKISDDGFCNGIFKKLFVTCKYEQQFKKAMVLNRKLSKKNKQLESDVEELRQQLCKQQEYTSNIDQQCLDNDKTTSNLNNQLIVMDDQLEAAKSQNEKLQDKIEHYIQLLTDNAEQISELEVSICQYQELIKNLENNNEELLHNLNISNDKYQNLYDSAVVDQVRMKKCEEQIHSYSTEYVNLVKQLECNENKLQFKQNTINELQQQLEILKQNLNISENRNIYQTKQITRYQQLHNCNRDQYEELNELYNALEQDYDCLHHQHYHRNVKRTTSSQSIEDELCQLNSL